MAVIKSLMRNVFSVFRLSSQLKVEFAEGLNPRGGNKVFYSETACVAASGPFVQLNVRAVKRLRLVSQVCSQRHCH